MYKRISGMDLEVMMSLVLLAFATRGLCSEAPAKNGFNFYKDYLRGRSDGLPEGPNAADRTLYYYRTPMQLYPGFLPALLEQEYRKRTVNAFKNHMLSKEAWNGSDAVKRSSKTALSLMLSGKHEPYIKEVGTCPFGK